jgi:hypothetical protein
MALCATVDSIVSETSLKKENWFDGFQGKKIASLVVG